MKYDDQVPLDRKYNSFMNHERLYIIIYCRIGIRIEYMNNNIAVKRQPSRKTTADIMHTDTIMHTNTIYWPLFHNYLPNLLSLIFGSI
jgi:hypothetical protein